MSLHSDVLDRVEVPGLGIGLHAIDPVRAPALAVPLEGSADSNKAGKAAALDLDPAIRVEEDSLVLAIEADPAEGPEATPRRAEATSTGCDEPGGSSPRPDADSKDRPRRREVYGLFLLRAEAAVEAEAPEVYAFRWLQRRLEENGSDCTRRADLDRGARNFLRMTRHEREEGFSIFCSEVDSAHEGLPNPGGLLEEVLARVVSHSTSEDLDGIKVGAPIGSARGMEVSFGAADGQRRSEERGTKLSILGDVGGQDAIDVATFFASVLYLKRRGRTPGEIRKGCLAPFLRDYNGPGPEGVPGRVVDIDNLRGHTPSFGGASEADAVRSHLARLSRGQEGPKGKGKMKKGPDPGPSAIHAGAISDRAANSTGLALARVIDSASPQK